MDEKNNYQVIQVTGIPANPGASKADFIYASSTVTAGTVYNSPLTGGKPQFTFEVKNNGTADVSTMPAGLYLSSDSAWSSDDLLIEEKTTRIYPDKTGDFYVSSYIPKHVTPGKHYLVIELNHRREISETDYSNNQVIIPIMVTAGQLPKLVVDDIIVSSHHWQNNQPYQLNAMILNEDYSQMGSYSWSS